MSDIDVIVIGSGPAGIAAAWPLVEAGLRVTMVDGADGPMALAPSDRPGLAAMRQGRQSHRLLGDGLEALRLLEDGSPKLRTAAGAAFHGGFSAANPMESRGFKAVGALVRGGLSTVWGAVTWAFAPQELIGWPAQAAASMAQSYARVAARMGLSGDGAAARRLGMTVDLPLQPALPLSPSAALLAHRWAASHPHGLECGQPLSAVLTQDVPGRESCSGLRACMWGCPQGAVWSAAAEVQALAAHGDFRLLSGLTVEALEADGTGWAVVARQAGGMRRLWAPRVVLAAGALASTRLALAAANRFGSWLPLANCPTQGFALLLPGRLGRPLPEEGYGNAQLCFRLAAGGERAFGLLYDGDSMAAPDIIARMPLSRPGAAALTRFLLPGLMIGLLYLPGSLSANRLRLERGAGGPRLVVEGGQSPALAPVRRRMAAALRGRFARLGALLLPGSLQALEPGAEVHVGASLPMGRETSDLGEMNGCPGLFVVDGAVLPFIPAESHTLTIMANADRIGQSLARMASPRAVCG